MASICGLDLGTQRCGYTVGDGSRLPHCDAWRFDQVGVDLGELGGGLWRSLTTLHREHQLTHVIKEEPIINRYRDTLLTLRKLYGVDMLVETFCDIHGIICCDEPTAALKRELAGRRNATKDDMVFVATRVGLTLPQAKADGREDAADSFAPWLVGVRHFAPEHLPMWDRALHGQRGTLV